MSEFVEVKTAELEGAMLDWAVSQVEGVETSWRYGRELVKTHDSGGVKLVESMRSIYSPSTDWSQGGPLTEKYRLLFLRCGVNGYAAYLDGIRPAFYRNGDTLLLAACRAIVASVLGDTVQVPKELVSHE